MRKTILACTTALALALGSGVFADPVQAQSAPASSEEALAAFSNPPNSARPRVWWHWMNGNITREGIAADIDWMSRVGLGGMQNFDASLITPQVVERRLAYMTPEWSEAFRFAAQRAADAGLELAIAGSPGWSETGGPWVPPEDGIKKLVWSETIVTGGRSLEGRLPAPPTATGSFQTMAAEGALGMAREGEPPLEVYRDVAVLAVPVASGGASGGARYTDGAGRGLDGGRLGDGELEHALDLGLGADGAPPMLVARFNEPREMRSATLLMRDARPSFDTARFSPRLEAKVGGAWQEIAAIEITNVPTTVAFEPVRAAEFRVVFAPYSGNQRPAQTAPAPGVITPPFIAPDSGRYPALVSEFTLSETPRIDRFETKAGYILSNDYYALATSADPADRGAAPGEVVDLTDRLRSDGSLDWLPPAGSDWKILRFGWTLTGKTNHPASPEATGLEVDKLDAQAVERYLRHYLDLYRDITGPELMGERGVRALLLDSTEVGAFNWTPRFVERFRELRGYDPLPWLPTVSGQLIGSRVDSDRFLYDFRRTLAEMHATEHYATVARVAREYGLRVYGEALEDQRPVIGDDMALRRYADVPMAALWTWSDTHGPRPTLLGDLKGASSVAHLYGQNVVAAESLTSALSPWSNAPSDLRRAIDLEFAHGVNLPIIHTSVHQPLERAPGLSLMIFGQFFNRHETWAEMARPWIDYIARSSYLLQQGRNVADVAVFYGEESPLSAQAAFGEPSGLPRRYAFDYVNADVLRDVLSVENGDLVAASGARYRILQLAGSSRFMTLPTLRRLAELVEQGATVVGRPPVGSPSLADERAAFDGLVDQLWSGQPETRVGLGRVIASDDVEGGLARLGVVPALDIDNPLGERDVMFVHRQAGDADIFFVLNRSRSARTLRPRFRVLGKSPELWSAETGTSRPISFESDGSATTVPLEIGPEQGVFVVFRGHAEGTRRIIAAPQPSPLLALDGPWRVAFQPGRGAPATIDLPGLISLSDHVDPGVRYFSGEATYTRTFRLPEGVSDAGPLWLDLGAVGDLAEVTVNGQAAGAVWIAPWRVDISQVVRPGENKVSIKVANLWVNRLIGDAQPGAEPIAFTTIDTFSADAPLRPSGLIGPVRLMGVVD